MSRTLHLRLADLERRLAASPSDDPLLSRDIDSLSEIECVEYWRRTARRPVPRSEPLSPQRRAEILAEWRALVR